MGSEEEGYETNHLITEVCHLIIICFPIIHFIEVAFQMWVQAYRVGKQLYDNTNNGIEAQNKAFKYSFLNCCRNMSMSRLIYLLVEIFVPTQNARYCII